METMQKGIEIVVDREIYVINLNAIRVDLITLLKSISKGYFLMTLKLLLKKQGIPFWNDGKYLVSVVSSKNRERK